jgi:hypothetical protein
MSLRGGKEKVSWERALVAEAAEVNRLLEQR